MASYKQTFYAKQFEKTFLVFKAIFFQHRFKSFNEISYQSLNSKSIVIFNEKLSLATFVLTENQIVN